VLARRHIRRSDRVALQVLVAQATQLSVAHTQLQPPQLLMRESLEQRLVARANVEDIGEAAILSRLAQVRVLRAPHVQAQQRLQLVVPRVPISGDKSRERIENTQTQQVFTNRPLLISR